MKPKQNKGSHNNNVGTNPTVFCLVVSIFILLVIRGFIGPMMIKTATVFSVISAIGEEGNGGTNNRSNNANSNNRSGNNGEILGDFHRHRQQRQLQLLLQLQQQELQIGTNFDRRPSSTAITLIRNRNTNTNEGHFSGMYVSSSSADLERGNGNAAGGGMHSLLSSLSALNDEQLYTTFPLNRRSNQSFRQERMHQQQQPTRRSQAGSSSYYNSSSEEEKDETRIVDSMMEDIPLDEMVEILDNEGTSAMGYRIGNNGRESVVSEHNYNGDPVNASNTNTNTSTRRNRSLRAEDKELSEADISRERADKLNRKRYKLKEKIELKEAMKKQKERLEKEGGGNEEDDNSNNPVKGEKICSICLESLICSMEKDVLECGHIFHSSCMTNWFVKSMICPICRFPVAGRKK